MSKKQKRIKVKITKTNHWYKEGEVHDVRNCVVFGYGDGEAHFEIEQGFYGINLKDCVVLTDEVAKDIHYDFLKSIANELTKRNLNLYHNIINDLHKKQKYDQDRLQKKS